MSLAVTESVELPTIPPPPKNSTPSQIRKNPFTQSESSSSEEAEEMKSDKEEEEVDNSLVRNEKTLPLAEGIVNSKLFFL